MAETVTISKEIEWDMGHRVPNHKSKCRNPHGHRYRLRVYVSGQIVEEEGASDEGMLIDFGDLKTLMTERVHDVLDHGFAYYVLDVTMSSFRDHTKEFKWIELEYIPTAENIARWVWDQLVGPIEEHFRGNLVLELVTIWETPTSQASYRGRPYVAPE